MNHPNIATLHAIEEHEDEMFIVMEYIEGRELRDLVGATGPVAPTDTITIATQIASVLQAAHEKGVTHRDIKSSNIMVGESGQVKNMGFGLARIAGNVGAGFKPAPTTTAPNAAKKHHGLPENVRAFKTFSSGRINKICNTSGQPVWQGNYYDRIIRIVVRSQGSARLSVDEVFTKVAIADITSRSTLLPAGRFTRV